MPCISPLLQSEHTRHVHWAVAAPPPAEVRVRGSQPAGPAAETRRAGGAARRVEPPGGATETREGSAAPSRFPPPAPSQGYVRGAAPKPEPGVPGPRDPGQPLFGGVGFQDKAAHNFTLAIVTQISGAPPAPRELSFAVDFQGMGCFRPADGTLGPSPLRRFLLQRGDNPEVLSPARDPGPWQ